MTRAANPVADEPRLSCLDLLALALGYALLLAIVVGLSVSMLDRIEGRPDEAWAQLQALLAWLDGPAR